MINVENDSEKKDMDHTEVKRKTFIGYEYKEIVADSEKASFLLDGYESFGWQVDENFTENLVMGGKGVAQGLYGKVMLRLKRDRKMVNRMELTRLQRNFEACVREIEELERAKTSRPTMWALIIGILGTAFMAGSVFAITAQPPHILLCIILAVPAFVGWVVPYFLYRKMLGVQTEKMNPVIEGKLDEIYEICEKGSKLLY